MKGVWLAVVMVGMLAHAAVAQTGGLIWHQNTLQKVSGDSAAFYPRLLPLQNGTLLLAYASGGSIVVRRSSTAGRTWQPPITVAPRRGTINEDTPELLQLTTGAVLLCYASRPQGAPQAGKRFDVRLKISTDNGATWASEKVLFEAGSSASEGCWEPALLQLSSGVVQLFFSDESVYPNSAEQNISMLQSSDGGRTWMRQPQIISFRKDSRDGMPVPLWLSGANRVVLAIEDPGVQNFKPYLVASDSGGLWHSPVAATDNRRWYGLLKKLPDSVYAGAPYLRQLSTGATVLSVQSTEGRAQNHLRDAVMVVTVGDSAARNFSHPSQPFAVPEGRSALWNSLAVLPKDTVVALTATTAFSGHTSEIWIIKGTLAPH